MEKAVERTDHTANKEWRYECEHELGLFMEFTAYMNGLYNLLGIEGDDLNIPLEHTEGSSKTSNERNLS